LQQGHSSKVERNRSFWRPSRLRASVRLDKSAPDQARVSVCVKSAIDLNWGRSVRLETAELLG
jgi:hypothetical protein